MTLAFFAMLSCLSASAQSAPPSGVEATSVALARSHGLAYDTAGNLYIADTDENIIRKVNLAGIITTVAGDGEQGYGGDGGLATAALLDRPAGVAVDSHGNIYIADTHNNRVREVVASSGNIVTVAGTGVAGFSGDGAAATVATLNYPTAVAVDSNGNVYIADTNNHRIREIAGTTINTVAGDGEQFYSGDGGAATAAGLDSPNGVAVDTAFNIYIGDTHNQRVRLVTFTTGFITTLAGTGVKGFTADGPAASAALARPRGVAVDTSGNVYLADSDNDRIRTIGGGNVTTIAGNGAEGFSGDGSASTSAWLDTPGAVAISGATVLFSDTENNRVRQVSGGMIDTIVGLANPPVQASLISPTPGSVLGSSAAFTWTSGSGPTAYELWLGTTGVGSDNLYNSGGITATSANVTGLPAGGVTVFARLYSKIYGAWRSTDYTYTEAGTPVPAALTTPTPGSVLPGSTVTFAWPGGAGPAAYQLWLGTTGVGSKNLYDSGSTTGTTETVSGLPTDGVTLYARLWSLIDGKWQSNDYTYMEAGTLVPAALTTPTPGSVLPGSTVTFAWPGGAGPAAYQLWLGTTGVGSKNLYDSGSTTGTTETVSGLPTDGVTLYARLWSLIDGKWQSNDYTYTEAGTLVPAALTTPTPGSVLPGSTVTFAWTAGTEVTQYQLWLGTTGVGSSNLYDSGSTKAFTTTVTGLPTNGVTVYARLYWEIAGAWKSADYTYTESGTPVAPVLTTPAPGSVLSGSSVAFTWTAGAGPAAYQLWLGTTGVGSSNLYNSGGTTATTETVSGLPTGGVTVFARLYSLISGKWQSNDYTYTEAGTLVPAALTTPTPGSTLAGSTVTFTWTAGAGPTEYQLELGTTGVGSSNLYNSGGTTATTETVSGLPTNGVKVYARLYQMINAKWQSTDYTYTAQ